jgi:hypothetical protein
MKTTRQTVEQAFMKIAGGWGKAVMHPQAFLATTNPAFRR